MRYDEIENYEQSQTGAPAGQAGATAGKEIISSVKRQLFPVTALAIGTMAERFRPR